MNCAIDVLRIEQMARHVPIVSIGPTVPVVSAPIEFPPNFGNRNNNAAF